MTSDDRQLAAGGEVADEGGEDLKRRRRGERLRVVERDHERTAVPEHPAEPGQHHGREACGVSAHRREDARLDGFEPLQRDQQVGEEDLGVVVPLVERQPGERPFVLTLPLPEEGRLAVAGRCREEDHGGVGGLPQPIDQLAPNHETVLRWRKVQLGLERDESDGTDHPPVLVSPGTRDGQPRRCDARSVRSVRHPCPARLREPADLRREFGLLWRPASRHSAHPRTAYLRLRRCAVHHPARVTSALQPGLGGDPAVGDGVGEG